MCVLLVYGVCMLVVHVCGMFVLLVYGVCSVRAGSACVHAVRAVIVCLSC